ncbi:DUF5321 domain-containing protein [Actinomadura sp. CNU-125]|uniref:DUF5321 domain-containing protein n=1 Tax=Actinomadura sp. CNU-125 TaxID=1904961 RepID=UPI000A59641C|nr:DUF5321 domain-containing protein [Actinomadura sp. CNU-125]
MFGADAKLRLLRGEDVDVDAVADLARHGVRLVGSGTTGVVCYPTCGDARRIAAEHGGGSRTWPPRTPPGYRPCARCRPA